MKEHKTAFKNPFVTSGRWYKANLHTHTTTSDGRSTVPERIAQYRRAGYHILALTDHGATHDVAGLSNSLFLVVNGIEFHPPCRREDTIHHFVGLGVPHKLTFTRPESPNTCIRDVHSVDGMDACVSATWLKMPALTVPHLLSAVRAGCCYSTNGPKITDFRVQAGKLRLRCSPAASIHFMGRKSSGASRWADEGSSVASFKTPRPNWPYVYAGVTDIRGRNAWTNPIAL